MRAFTFRVVLLASSLVGSAFLSVYAESKAFANGRFPLAQTVVTSNAAGADGAKGPNDTLRIVMRTTFGAVVSEDGGATFSWLCEEGMGFSGTWDPPLALTPDKTLYVGLPTGLRRGSNPCALEKVASLEGEVVIDLAASPSGDHVVGITATPTKPGFVFAKKGPAFERLAKGPAGVRFETIEVAPSSRSRVYVTGVPEGEGPRARFFRSDDGGRTLRELKVSLPIDGPLFISAVDPADPNRILVRQLHRAGSELLLSTDGGATFTNVLHVDGSMTGFAMADDGVKGWAGSGNPKEGLYQSVDRGATWARILEVAVLCLHAAGPRLFVCSNHYLPGGHALLVSDDGGRSAKPLLDFPDVRGPVLCDTGEGAACTSKWADLRATLLPRRPASLGTEGGVPASSNSVSSGSAPAADGAAAPVARPAASRCGCRAIPENSVEIGSFLPALALAFWGLRRRSGGSS